MGINWIKKDSYFIIGKNCIVWTSTRPQYCDRGNYLFHLEAAGTLALDIDFQDLWPRYYFDWERGKAETIDWLKTRDQFIEGSEWIEGDFTEHWNKLRLSE